MSSIFNVGVGSVRGAIGVVIMLVLGFIVTLAYFGIGAKIETSLPAPDANTTLGAVWATISGAFNSAFGLSPLLLLIGIFVTVLGMVGLLGHVSWGWF